MKDKIFFDTSILVYAFTLEEKKKRRISKKLVEDVFRGKIKGIVSNQVLSELFFVLVEKKKIRKEFAEIITNSFILSEKWKKINYTFETIEKAKRISIEHNLKFWDSLIVATMLENDVKQIYTENEKDFKKVKELKVLNPFKSK